MTEPTDDPGDNPGTSTSFTISEPATIIQRAFDIKVSAADLERAFETLHALPPEDCTKIAARVVCLIQLFGDPEDRRKVTARVAAIDWRCMALARLYCRPEFKSWFVRDDNGVITITPILLEAAATEPLVEIDGEPGVFDADRFFNRLRLQ
jgi:hypothetical protein